MTEIGPDSLLIIWTFCGLSLKRSSAWSFVTYYMKRDES